MTPAKKSASDKKNVTTIRGDVVDSVIVTGDNNQTIIQTFFNIFKSDTETLEQRNRRILLGHVENAWIKGVLDASLHGAALLDLGIKQEPEAVTKYPWAIKKESTNETLPAGTSMLEIFNSIGMGRSLLILGAPGSGKTTMLLELARGLITRAREDITQPIPMVFNLASWTEKLSLADWLAQELNNLYSVPRKTAPDWVKGNKLLLLLDGLDEVRQESRTKCVEAINEFRKQNGLTSLAVCSRSQDYADLKAKLSFEGAIEVQPLMQKQIAEFFNRFGDEMTGIKQALEKDSTLREMAETPLFLSIMLMAYRDKKFDEIPVFADMNTQWKYLFDQYIERMFDRYQRPSRKFELKPNKTAPFKKQDTLYLLSWLGYQMISKREIVFLISIVDETWLPKVESLKHRLVYRFVWGIVYGIAGMLSGWWISALIFGALMFNYMKIRVPKNRYISEEEEKERGCWFFISLPLLVLSLMILMFLGWLINPLLAKYIYIPIYPLVFLIGITILIFYYLEFDLEIEWFAGRLMRFPFLFSFVFCLLGYIYAGSGGLLIGALIGWLLDAERSLFYAFLPRMILLLTTRFPWDYRYFLDFATDLIFLRRVGGGYIFVHRLLMEHFAEMYMETPTSKGN